MNREEIIQWTNNQGDHVTRVLREERISRTRTAGLHRIRADLMDPEIRCLSEMPLCAANLDLALPPGFHPAGCEIEIGSNNVQDHIYAKRRDEILCVTPGQFVDRDNTDTKPGDRIRLLRQRAPELFVDVKPGIVALHGTIDQIEQQLGLNYR